MTATAILGIDPGLSGALALLDVDGSLEVVDMPTLQLKKRVIDGTASSAHAKAMSERVLPLAEKAWDFARKAGA